MTGSFDYGRVAPGGGTSVLERPGVDDGTDDLTDWFCVVLEEQEECGRCGFTSPAYWENDRAAGRHVVVVWPDEEDPNMLRLLAEEYEGRGEVAIYDRGMGRPALSWYALRPS